MDLFIVEKKNTYRTAISLSLDLKIIWYTLHILEQKSYHCISSVTKKDNDL